MVTQEPLDYARAACDTMMKKYEARNLPPEGHFHYHQGVFLSGVCRTASLTHEERYWNYVSDWICSVFTSDGKIRDYSHAALDDIQPGILLYPLMDHDSRNMPFYLAAVKSVWDEVADIPRCRCGGFGHKPEFPHQMWLDGLYMVCPFLAEYSRRFHQPELLAMVVDEILLMRKNTRDSETGLWYHAWDEDKKEDWADAVTGRSPEFWGRSMGWVPVAVLDVLAQMEPDDKNYEILVDLVKDYLVTICSYQADDGRWYQVINKARMDGNWLENSCSCLFAAAIARAVRMNILEPEFLHRAIHAFEGVVRTLEWDGENLLIGHVCVGTGVGDYEFYCQRPTSVNDLHGVGAFLLMCTELQEAIR